eukprot:764011-Alexandrium_andersonii.AAC.1
MWWQPERPGMPPPSAEARRPAPQFPTQPLGVPQPSAEAPPSSQGRRPPQPPPSAEDGGSDISAWAICSFMALM